MTARLQGNRERDSKRCVGVVERRRRKSTGRGDRNFNVFVSSVLLSVFLCWAPLQNC